MPSALVIAARLARQGFQVTVAEKNKEAGGCCDRLVRDGHHFDTGPTLFLMPEIVAHAFAGLGERMEDHLDLRRIEPTYHIHFGNGSTLTLTSDLNAIQAQMEAIEHGSVGGLLRYLSEGRRHYELVFSHVAGRNFHNLMEYFSPRSLLLIFRLKALTKHYANLGNYFADDRLRTAFTFQDMYVGLSPYEAPATYSLLQYAEMTGGVWFPKGGMYRLVEALVNIAEKNGVRLMYDTPVARINVDDRQTTGATLADGREIRADVVVANADLPYVYRHLLPDDAASQDWDALRKRARQLVLQRLAEIGVSDLEEHIKFEGSFSPPDWRDRYNLAKGSSYGLSHTFMQMGYLRPRNRHARYRNLYFVGASTHPGAGLPTVLISARLATERVLKDMGMPKPVSGSRKSSLAQETF
jgi:phytoene dehydrogenase-like protein